MAGGSTGERNTGTEICCGISLSRPNGSVAGNRVTPLGGGAEQCAYFETLHPAGGRRLNYTSIEVAY